MDVFCAAHNASGCKNKVKISWPEAVKNFFNTGGKYTNIDKYCPEHLEWVTFGRVSDNDPQTNPEFNKE